VGVEFRGPTRQEERELCQTGLRRPGENLTNCHREAKVTAPLLDSTQNASGPTLGRRGSGVDPHIGSAQCTCAGLLSHVQELEVDGKEVATSIRQFRKAVWLTWILQWPYSAKTDRLFTTASAAKVHRLPRSHNGTVTSEKGHKTTRPQTLMTVVEKPILEW